MRAQLRILPAGLLAGSVAGVLDGWFAIRTSGSGLWFAAVSAGVLALLGFFAAAPVHLFGAGVVRAWRTVWGEPEAPARALGGLAGVLVLGALLYLMGATLFAQRGPYASGLWIAGAIAAGLAALATARALGRMAARSPWVSGVVALAVGLSAGLLWWECLDIVENLDLRIGWVLWAFLTALVVADVLLSRSWAGLRWVRPALVVAALGLVAFAAQTLLVTGQARVVAARYAPATGPAVRILSRAADFDGDGYSPISGEADCAPHDARIHPFAVEIPGNGIDEDCFAGDLDPARLQAAQRNEKPAAPPAAQRPDVFLLTVDTLRADRVGLMGTARPLTPRIDAFFRGGVIFERAYTHSPVTDRALPAMFAGLYPSMFTEALDWRRHKLASRRVLLAERLRDAGYRTHAVVNAYMIAQHGLDQGFEDLDMSPVKATREGLLPGAKLVTDLGIAALDRHLARGDRGPLFLWLHYYDPHGPYEAPPQYRRWSKGRSTAANRADRYDAEVLYVDDEAGRFLRALEERGLGRRPLVVLASDHGEEFFEHGGWYHAEKLYDESVRVPWLLSGPGLTPRRVKAPVGLVDFMPTLLDLLDIPAPPSIEGRSQARAARGDGPVDARPIILEQFKHRTDQREKLAVVDGRWKLILDLENQLWELYDVVGDPRERINRFAAQPEVASRLRTLLLDYLARVQAARAMNLRDGAF